MRDPGTKDQPLLIVWRQLRLPKGLLKLWLSCCGKERQLAPVLQEFHLTVRRFHRQRGLRRLWSEC